LNFRQSLSSRGLALPVRCWSGTSVPNVVRTPIAESLKTALNTTHGQSALLMTDVVLMSDTPNTNENSDEVDSAEDDVKLHRVESALMTVLSEVRDADVDSEDVIAVEHAAQRIHATLGGDDVEAIYPESEEESE